jgi:hypothetical protein
MSCYNDTKITISVSDIFKKYRITSHELKKSKLTECDPYSYICGKYLADEIEVYADTITKKLPPTHPKREAYLKQKAIFRATRDKEREITEKKYRILHILSDISVKIDDPQMYSFYIDKDIMDKVTLYARDTSLLIFDAVMEIEKLLEIRAVKNKKITDIENRCKELKLDIAEFKNLDEYHLFIENNKKTNVNAAIAKFVVISLAHKNRNNVLEKHLFQLLDGHHFKFNLNKVKRNPNYKKYINGTQTLEQFFVHAVYPLFR